MWERVTVTSHAKHITSIFDGVRVRHNFSRRELKLQRGCSFQRRRAILSFPHLLEVRQHVHPDPANWTWVDRAQWIEPVQGSPWQVFAHKWRNSEVLVQEDPAESTLDNLALPGSEDDSFMIRKCYVDAEKLVWNRAIFAPKTGVILSGQPLFLHLPCNLRHL